MLDKSRIRNDATRVLKAIQLAGDQSDEMIAKAIEDVVKLVDINRAYKGLGQLPERLDAEPYDPEAISEDQYGYDTMVNTTTIYMLKSYEASDLHESEDGSSRASRSKSKGGSQQHSDLEADSESFSFIMQGLSVIGEKLWHLASFYVPAPLSRLGESLATGAAELAGRVVSGLMSTDVVGLGISTAVGLYTARAGERINYRPLQSHGILLVGGVAFSYIPYIDFEVDTQQRLLSVSNTAKVVSGVTTMARQSAALASPVAPTGLKVLAALSIVHKVVMNEWVYGRKDFPKTQQELSFFMYEMSLNVADNVITADHAKDLIYGQYGAFLRPRSVPAVYVMPSDEPMTLSEPVNSKRSANFDDFVAAKRQRTFAVPDVVVRNYLDLETYRPNLDTAAFQKPVLDTVAFQKPTKMHAEVLFTGPKVKTRPLTEVVVNRLKPRPDRGSEAFFRRVLPPETPRPNMVTEYIYDGKPAKKQQQQPTADDVLKALVATYGYDRVAAVEEALVQARVARTQPSVAHTQPSVAPDPKNFNIEFMFGGGDIASLITEHDIPKLTKSFTDLGAAMFSAVKGDADRYKVKGSGGKPYAIEPQVMQDVPIGKPIINVIKEGREAQLRLVHRLTNEFERFLEEKAAEADEKAEKKEEEYKQEPNTDKEILDRMMTHIGRLLYRKVTGEISAPFVNLGKLMQPLLRADTYHYFLENVLKPSARATHKFVIVPASDAAYYVDDFLHRGETMEDLDKELDWIDTGFVKSLGDLYTWARSVDDDVPRGDMRGFDHHSKATTNSKGVIGSLIDSGQIGVDLDLAPDVEIKDIASIQTVLAGSGGGGEPDVPLKPILAKGVETWIRDTHVDQGLEHLSGQVVFNHPGMYADQMLGFTHITNQGPPVETLATYKPITRVPRPVEVYDAQVVFKQAFLPKDPLLNFASISDQGPKQAQDKTTEQGPKVDQETSTETKVGTPNTQTETRDQAIPTVVNVEKKEPFVLKIEPVVDDSFEKAIERDKSIRANLRPFLAMVGTDSFNEQAESDRLKANNLMMGQLPQRHIGTAVSNPLQFGQMVQEGVRYSGDLDATPVYYMGGSLTEGDELYGTVRNRMPDVPTTISRSSKIFKS